MPRDNFHGTCGAGNGMNAHLEQKRWRILFKTRANVH